MKLCINCKHYVVDDSLPKTKYSRCGRIWRISPVDGEKSPLEQLPYCSVERLANGTQHCDQEGQFFEEATNV